MTRSEWIALAAGAAASVVLIHIAWSSSETNWQLDWDVPLMAAVVLAPAGPAVAVTLVKIVQRPLACWTWNTWLWPGLAIVGVAWVEVMLDGGLYLGPVGKLLGGVTAMLGTPALGVYATVGFAVHRFRPSTAARPVDAAVLILIFVQLPGFGWLLAVMLPTRW